VVVRDAESEAALRRVGVQGNILVGSDAALGLIPAPLEKISMPEPIRKAMSATGSPRVGLCLSAQDAPKNLSAVVSVLDRLIADANATIFGIPINPVTDSRLVREIRPQCKAPERVFVLEGIIDPEEVAGALGQMDVIVSTRLHGLILASLSDIPLVGISRGTKIDTFLRPFGLRPAGSFQNLDVAELEQQIRQRLAQAAEFRQRAAVVRLERRQALETTRQRLKSLLERIADEPGPR